MVLLSDGKNSNHKGAVLSRCIQTFELRGSVTSDFRVTAAVTEYLKRTRESRKGKQKRRKCVCEPGRAADRSLLFPEQGTPNIRSDLSRQWFISEQEAGTIKNDGTSSLK